MKMEETTTEKNLSASDVTTDSWDPSVSLDTTELEDVDTSQHPESEGLRKRQPETPRRASGDETASEVARSENQAGMAWWLDYFVQFLTVSGRMLWWGLRAGVSVIRDVINHLQQTTGPSPQQERDARRLEHLERKEKSQTEENEKIEIDAELAVSERYFISISTSVSKLNTNYIHLSEPSSRPFSRRLCIHMTSSLTEPYEGLVCRKAAE